MKRIMKSVVALASVMAMLITPLHTEAKAVGTMNLRTAYYRVLDYAEENGITLSMTYQDFVDNYSGQDITAYEKSYYSAMAPSQDKKGATAGIQSSSSGSGTYYYNTGYDCPSRADYSRYKLVKNLQKGDIIYEANGGFGITGHIAIVEGFYRRSDGTSYVRVIEAISDGVVRSILDDKRCDDKAVTVLRVKNATSSQIDKAVSFCAGEVGSKYSLDFAKDTSSSETDWYCSELVWAAYKNQGIDLEVSGVNEPGITPRDIKRNTSKLNTISYK